MPGNKGSSVSPGNIIRKTVQAKREADVILLFGGLELAANAKGATTGKEERYIAFLTAGLAMWNKGVGYLVGLLLAIACERKWVRALGAGTEAGRGRLSRMRRQLL